MEYTKYIVLILIGVAIANIWLYIRRLEYEKQVLLNAFETKLMLQFKNKPNEETDDTN